MLHRNCYLILQITSDSSEAEIRSAYRKRSKELHPDVNPDPKAADDFADLAAAVETLTDPVQRLKHDAHFGYNSKVKNQKNNAKQSFSEFQTRKASSTVSEWTNDYEKAMNMRQQQRLKHIESHKKRMKWIVLVAISTLILSIGAAVLIFLSAS
jgi:DnaJ-class molecular chaperone